MAVQHAAGGLARARAELEDAVGRDVGGRGELVLEALVARHLLAHELQVRVGIPVELAHRRKRTLCRVNDALRALPPVDALAAEVDAPRAVALAAARAVLAERRAELLSGDRGGGGPRGAGARAAEAARRPSLRRVLNATGVIVHTNLGRAPLAAAARAAVARVPRRATRTSSATSRRASAARATTTSRRCCAS